MNRAEAPLPAALQSNAPKFMSAQRPADVANSPEKKAALAVNAPTGSIAAIESRLGF
ncbi:hypothetical protein MKI84_05540 [Ancylobacter sp. A5.8]|uniref:hypothetical protein n=1 Tax=Ancylobacter gelatini TaxID=2919920 RepID=UPI001F4D790C|nr:hypothetical protein [Ancylobacter gelatini]MCJ8142372.1 hypothetical protein [Ancylobacter gelatini]